MKKLTLITSLFLSSISHKAIAMDVDEKFLQKTHPYIRATTNLSPQDILKFEAFLGDFIENDSSYKLAREDKRSQDELERPYKDVLHTRSQVLMKYYVPYLRFSTDKDGRFVYDLPHKQLLGYSRETLTNAAPIMKELSPVFAIPLLLCHQLLELNLSAEEYDTRAQAIIDKQSFFPEDELSRSGLIVQSFKLSPDQFSDRANQIMRVNFSENERLKTAGEWFHNEMKLAMMSSSNTIEDVVHRAEAVQDSYETLVPTDNEKDRVVPHALNSLSPDQIHGRALTIRTLFPYISEDRIKARLAYFIVYSKDPVEAISDKALFLIRFLSQLQLTGQQPAGGLERVFDKTFRGD